MKKLAALSLAMGVALVWNQTPLEGVRWWTSRPLSATVHLSAEQAAAIEAIYDASIAESTGLTEQAAGIRQQIALMNRDDRATDEDLMDATERLARVEETAASLRRRQDLRIEAILTPQQRELVLGTPASTPIDRVTLDASGRFGEATTSS